MLAAVVMLPFVWRRFKNVSPFLLMAGGVLGLLNGLGYYGQTMGLKTISSAESAFITSMTVIIVPFLAPMFRLGKPHWLELTAAVICLYGVFVLTGSNLAHLNSAEWWTFLCALTTALSILYLQVVSRKIDDFVVFTFIQILFCALIPLSLTVKDHQYTAVFNYHVITGLLYCAILSTALTFFLQSRFQQYTSPTKVGIIFAMEPVFASIIAFFFNGEALGKTTLIGGGIILVSILLS